MTCWFLFEHSDCQGKPLQKTTLLEAWRFHWMKHILVALRTTWDRASTTVWAWWICCAWCISGWWETDTPQTMSSCWHGPQLPRVFVRLLLNGVRCGCACCFFWGDDLFVRFTLGSHWNSAHDHHAFAAGGCLNCHLCHRCAFMCSLDTWRFLVPKIKRLGMI